MSDNSDDDHRENPSNSNGNGPGAGAHGPNDGTAGGDAGNGGDSGGRSGPPPGGSDDEGRLPPDILPLYVCIASLIFMCRALEAKGIYTNKELAALARSFGNLNLDLPENVVLNHVLDQVAEGLSIPISHPFFEDLRRELDQAYRPKADNDEGTEPGDGSDPAAKRTKRPGHPANDDPYGDGPQDGPSGDNFSGDNRPRRKP